MSPKQKLDNAVSPAGVVKEAGRGLFLARLTEEIHAGELTSQTRAGFAAFPALGEPAAPPFAQHGEPRYAYGFEIR